jgi:hypothetical protein
MDCCQSNIVTDGGTPWYCTAEPGHTGQHEATVLGGRVIASWPNLTMNNGGLN